MPILPSADAFWRRLATAAGPSAAMAIKRAAQARRSGEPTVDVYDLVYANRASTRASAQLVSPLLQPWLEWWAEADVAGSVLDLGCGAGFYACFVAQQNPAVEVVGVDGSAPAIQQARALAAEIGLDNVEFVHGDVLSLALGRRFDVISSTLLLAEIETVPYPSGRFRLVDVIEQSMGLRESALAETVASHLAHEGRYVSIERLGDLPRTAWWIGALRAAGLHIDLAEFDRFDFESAVEGRSRMPIVVARGAHAASPSTSVTPEALIERGAQLGYSDAARPVESWLNSADGVELLGGAVMGGDDLPTALVIAAARGGALGVLVAYDNGVQHCAWVGADTDECEATLNGLANGLTDGGFRLVRNAESADLAALRGSA